MPKAPRISKGFPCDLMVEHLVAVMPAVLPQGTATRLPQEAAQAIWTPHAAEDNGRTKAIWSTEDECCYCFLYTAPRGAPPIAALRVEVPTRPVPMALKFLRMFSGIANKDLATLTLLGAAWESPWNALRSTQFVRAIAAATDFDGHDAARWIGLIDQATRLTYEGTQSRMMVVIPSDPAQFRTSVGDAYIPLQEPMEIQRALFAEKWVRAVVDGERVALVGRGEERGQIDGFLSLHVLPEHTDRTRFAPHESLRLLQANMRTPDLAMVSAENGDFYVLTGGAVWWQKHQGRWRTAEFSTLYATLLKHVEVERFAVELVRMCLDLSFERSGALLCVMDNTEPTPNVSDLVVDYGRSERTNAPLRRALRGTKVLDWGFRQVVTAAAGTDGATVFSPAGELLDISCMIADAPDALLQRWGIAERRSFAGARSRAAWNASMSGVAIKVSEDGPITVYHHGDLMFSTSD